jgi:hypothetical protein
MSTRLRRATHMAYMPELGRTHVWVGMCLFESNRVRLGPNQVSLGPGLCPGRPTPFIYPLGAPSIRLDYVKQKKPISAKKASSFPLNYDIPLVFR